MITHFRIQNFRSFLDAEVDLQPFSLVVGANGSGKSNLLKFFALVGGKKINGAGVDLTAWKKHQQNDLGAASGLIDIDTIPMWSISFRDDQDAKILNAPDWFGYDLPIYNIDPNKVSQVETTIPAAKVASDGSGTAQVLDALKNGDREDLFDKIEESFRRYVPEVEKLSLRTVQDGKKQIQVREKGLGAPLPATELSEGTRLILCILTILHQENPPPVILLEDIDRGLHPRLFEYVAPLMRDIAVRNKINIIATSHNPYLVDCFQDHKEAVIIVEKKDGASTLTTLAKQLEGLDYETVDPEDMPLGSLWYSGLIGGTPKKISAEARH